MNALFLILAALLAQQPQAETVRTPESGIQAAATAPTAPPNAAPQERLICRRRVRSGTLAGFENDCRTEADWRALYRGTEQSWRQVQGTFGSTNCRANGGTC